MIALEGVSLACGRAQILDGITLRVAAEVVALVGPSGAGKTSVLRVLAGLQPPSKGRVALGGRLASDEGRVLVAPEDRRIAMVFQDLALWPHLSVYGNLDFGLRAQRLDRAARDERIARALGSVGLGDCARRRPHELSGGEQQRVAVARALVLEPAALLLDEPLGRLDIALKDELCELFARLFTVRPLSVIYVTHDPREAAWLSSRVVVLERGQVTQDAPFDELARAPATRFVEAFARPAAPRP